MNYDLSPKIAERLNAAAQMRRIDPTKLLESLVADALPPVPIDSADKGLLNDHFYFTASNEQFQDAIDEIALMNRGLPLLSDEAFDRANLYEDRI